MRAPTISAVSRARASGLQTSVRTSIAGDGLGELARLGAARVVERHREVALEAALRVVGRLPVAGQVDHGPEFAANAPGPPRR